MDCFSCRFKEIYRDLQGLEAAFDGFTGRKMEYEALGTQVAPRWHNHAELSGHGRLIWPQFCHLPRSVG